ncbi:DNA internalization-related competence protein ComEC/Rec2 [Neisseria lisongii]|uniref:DNA internalization-related competence protein ComEC/Rec2 n=1 Tax=Neisseria lisongii TaxID=2912188 RepID=A0AAW5AMR1_9NEIS|nr:DNA internalization-related competence protein ComEC/Rec2 [Neisseria lisongii]MCF7529218.1 DNA internalization-related competence protein ComEC/Rec2 [Neisseria lisongii]
MLMPYLLPCWVLGVAVSFALPFVPHWAVWAAVLFGLAGLALRFRWSVWVLAAVAGMVYGVWRTESALAGQWPLVQREAALTVEVVDLPYGDSRKTQFLARAWRDDGRVFQLLLSDYGKRDWPVGSRWRVGAKLRPAVGAVNIRGLNRETWALANGIGGVGTLAKGRQRLVAGSASVWALWRERIRRSWQRSVPPEYGFSDGMALMRTLSIGEQSALRPAVWQAFRPLGMTHLVSISGLHVTMVALMCGGLMKMLLRCSPYLPQRPKRWVLVGGLLGAAAYAALSGFSVPTQRSVLMLAVLAWAWLRGRGATAWSGWWAALAAVLLFDPSAVLGVGTWLSFGLIASLIWVSAGRLGRASGAEKNIYAGFQTALHGQWAATVGSLVLLGSIFASLPLISPLVNALAIPWFSWVLTPLALLGSLLPLAPLQILAAALAEYTLRALVWLTDFAPEWAVAVPPVPLLALAAVAAAVALLPRGSGMRLWAWLVLAGFVFYRQPPLEEGRLKIVVLDAGQGLSVLLQTKEHDLLFDTGTAAAAATGIVPSLNALGIRRLDKLILSHHDSDHDGGFPAVRRNRTIADLAAGQPEFYATAQLCGETSWWWNGVYFEFLRPAGKVSNDDNDQSCVLRAVAGNQAVMITGDLGQKGEAALVAKYGEALYSSVLVLGHHGSSSASSGVFLNAVSPRYAVASSGYANSYRHPTQEVQNRVRAHGIKLLRTDYQGALQFELGGSGEIFQGGMRPYRFYWQKKPFTTVP